MAKLRCSRGVGNGHSRSLHGCLVSRTLGSVGASLSFFWAEYAAVIEIFSSSTDYERGMTWGVVKLSISCILQLRRTHMGGMHHWERREDQYRVR
ncbi:hypothetical protein LB504_008317 [Fusarium proliferatum]|nr:hypothetical protein LB504_008317 [Fusarium proliferatum]